MSLTKVTYSMINGAVANVLDYGALADGSDDTLAIQAALDSGKSTVYFPKGSYTITAALQIKSNGIRILGDGPEVTKILQTGSNVSAIESLTTIIRLLWCEISNIRIEMPGGSSGHGIHIRNPESFKCDFCRVTTLSPTKTTGYGIYIQRESDTDFGYYTRITHTHVDKCLTGVVIAGASPGGANSHWCDAVISNDNTDYGFYVLNASGVYLQNCAAEINTHNIYIEAGFGVQVEGCRLERPKTHNIYIVSGQGHLIDANLLASAGFVNTATGRAIYFAGGQFCRATNNVIQDGFSSFDIEVVSGVLNAVILDNIARNTALGWDVGGPRVTDSGTDTYNRSIVNTASNSFVRHFTQQFFDSGIITVGPSTTTKIYSGTGTPEAVVTATVGSIFLRTNGGAGTTLYVKESGAGDTGWVAK